MIAFFLMLPLPTTSLRAVEAASNSGSIPKAIHNCIFTTPLISPRSAIAPCW